MQNCSRCGAEIDDGISVCPSCGYDLSLASAEKGSGGGRRVFRRAPGQSAHDERSHRRPKAKQTMLGMGMSPPGVQPGGAPGAGQKSAGKQTMLGMGMSPPGVQPGGSPGVGQKSAGKQTMLGVGMAPPLGRDNAMPAQRASSSQGSAAGAGHVPRSLAETMRSSGNVGQAAMGQGQAGGTQAEPAKKTFMGVGVSPSSVPPPMTGEQVSEPNIPPAAQTPSEVGNSSAKKGASAKRTMLGVAMPGIAPTGPAPGANQAQNGPKRTMLGVAMPGIAPTYDKPPPGPAQPAATPGFVQQPSGYQPVSGDYEQPEDVSPPRVEIRPVVPIHKRPLFFVAIAGVLLTVAVLLFALLWPTKPPIDKVEASVDKQGHDVLSITCPTCPDGTVLTVDGAHGKVKQNQASLVLAKPLQVGDNRLKVQIDRPDSGRDETVEVAVPLMFRVRPDLSHLSSPSPFVVVSVQAKPGATVRLNGKQMPVDGKGAASLKIDIADRCRGQSNEVSRAKLDVAYEITWPEGKKAQGTLPIEVPIVPLVIHSPRPHMITVDPKFELFGETKTGAKVSIGKQQLEVDAEGQFSHDFVLDKVDRLEVTVRASLKGMASRSAVIHVQRVSSLRDTMSSWEHEKHLDTKGVFGANQETGGRVVLTGYVADVNTVDHDDVVLVDAGGVCEKAPCLTRVLVDRQTHVRKGQYVKIFGYLSRVFEVDGRQVPQIDAAFVSIRSKGKHR